MRVPSVQVWPALRLFSRLTCVAGLAGVPATIILFSSLPATGQSQFIAAGVGGSPPREPVGALRTLFSRLARKLLKGGVPAVEMSDRRTVAPL